MKPRMTMTVIYGPIFQKWTGTDYVITDHAALIVYDGDDEVAVYAPGMWHAVKFRQLEERNNGNDQGA